MTNSGWRRPVNFKGGGKVGKWYEIKNVSTDKATVHIYDEIGMWGVTAADFVQELQGVDTSVLDLHINSPGGDVFDGLAILNALRGHRARVEVTVDGLAASAASFIAMAGDQVTMAQNAMMMIHEAHGLEWGDAQDLRAKADLLDKASQNLAEIYASKAGKDAAYWRDQMRAETWYNDQEAVDAGLADKILSDTTNRSPSSIYNTATAVHHTATVDEEWDAGEARRNYPNQESTLKAVHAWFDPEGDPDSKSSYRFPHHKTKGGPANLHAVRNGLARLEGSDVDDKAGVRAHLEAHLADGQGDAGNSHDVTLDSRLDPGAIARAFKEAMKK